MAPASHGIQWGWHTSVRAAHQKHSPDYTQEGSKEPLTQQRAPPAQHSLHRARLYTLPNKSHDNFNTRAGRARNRFTRNFRISACGIFLRQHGSSLLPLRPMEEVPGAERSWARTEASHGPALCHRPGAAATAQLPAPSSLPHTPGAPRYRCDTDYPAAKRLLGSLCGPRLRTGPTQLFHHTGDYLFLRTTSVTGVSVTERYQ